MIEQNAPQDIHHLQSEVARLTRLLGSHADGHRCTCTLTDPGNYDVAGGNAHPPEWEQDPWCPTHPNVDAIKYWVEGLIHNWHEEADAGVDERYGRVIARVLHSCANELTALVRPQTGAETGA